MTDIRKAREVLETRDPPRTGRGASHIELELSVPELASVRVAGSRPVARSEKK
jgi:hypothetical protein